MNSYAMQNVERHGEQFHCLLFLVLAFVCNILKLLDEHTGRRSYVEKFFNIIFWASE